MLPRSVLVLAVVGALLASGCASTQGSPPAGNRTAPPTHEAGAGQGVIEGIVTDPELQPIPKAAIEIGSRRESNFSASLATDATGKFRAAGLATGEYILYVSALGYREMAPKLVTVGDEEPVRLEIVLEPLAILEPFHTIKRYGLLFREQICVINQGAPACVTGYVVANTTTTYDNKEQDLGELHTMVVQMQWTPTVGFCAGAMRSDVFSPDQESPGGPSYFETGVRAPTNPYHWDNNPESIRSPTRLFIPRDGPEPIAMWSPNRTELNDGAPITIDGKWTFTFYPQPKGQFGTPVDFSCIVEQPVTAYVAAFHSAPAAPDWTVFQS